jgi:acyl-CoA reductase-like NAD-dependent aldehyde dehydrogenase
MIDLPRYQHSIGGRFVDAASGETLDVHNPADGKVIARVPASGPEDVDRAVKHYTLPSEMPFGGVKESGYGRDGSAYALEDYTSIKHVMINSGRQQWPS